MLPLDVDGAADRAFEKHVEHLIDELLLNHSPFRSKESNDNAIQRFEVGLKHMLGVRQLTEDAIARVCMEREPG